MTEPGETDGYSIIDHVDAILKHSRGDILDYVIANTEEIPKNILQRYERDGSVPVIIKEDDERKLAGKGITLIGNSLVYIEKDYIKHNNIKLSELLIHLEENRP